MLRSLAVALLLLAAGPSAGAEADRIKIVTTTSDLAAIAEAVALDRAEVVSICTGKEDPHHLQARPSFILQARDADLWIRIGLELEIGWEAPIIDGSRNTRIRMGTRGHLDASRSALIADVPTTPVTRAMGDVHPLGNPHYWLDPLNGRRVAGAIAERLAEIAPSDADFFRANAAAFQRALDVHMFGEELLKTFEADSLWNKTDDGTIQALLSEEANRGKAHGWVAAMAALRGTGIVTYHTSWVYFARRFGLSVVDELEPKPGVPPTAVHLAQLASTASAAGVKIILQEPFYSTKAADQIAAKIGARVVVVANSVGGGPGAGDYISLMDTIVQAVSGAR